jgi:hypothetical protein
MVSIYDVFSKDRIEINDDYTGDIKLHTLHNVTFQAKQTDDYNFLACLGMVDSKIQSILNKQFYYIPEVFKGFCGVDYSRSLREIYESITTSAVETHQDIITPVFYFMDYESTNGSGHTHDILFYLIYMYKKFHLTCPIVIPKSTNKHYRSLIHLLQTYYNVDFMEIEYGKTYHFKTIFCTRTYLNIFYLEVKSFIHDTLIQPILLKYKDHPYHTSIAKVKIKQQKMFLTPQATFDYSESFENECKETSVYLFDDDLPEDLKIYYLNNASNILVSWGSIYYIYICYYLSTTEKKFISVLFHPVMMPERGSLFSNNGVYYQQMFHATRNIQQVYNTLRFEGEVIDNTASLEEYIMRSSFFKRLKAAF